MGELQVGTSLKGRYRIDAKLGEGGMAEVYRAFDLQRRATVALKLLKPDYAEDAAFVQRFRREARSLQRLSHPNIVRFYELEEEGNLTCLVLDFIDGPTLRNILRRRGQPLTPGEVLGYLRPVCAALSYAHQQGVVHCDMKPANVMIDHTGRVFVNDFGIARLSESATITFSTPGTAAYMAPEQWRGGEDISPATDVYALGVTLLELLTGQLPFRGETAPSKGHHREKIMWEHLNGAVPVPSQLNLAVPRSLDEVVLRCMEKEASHRYQSADELLSAFADACAAAGVVETPAGIPDGYAWSIAGGSSLGSAPVALVGTTAPKRPGSLALGVGLMSGFGLAVAAGGVVVIAVVLAFLVLGTRTNGMKPGLPTATAQLPPQQVVQVIVTATGEIPIPASSGEPSPLTAPPTDIPGNTSASTRAAPPTAVPAPVFECPGAPPSRVSVGDRARVTYTSGVPTRVRASPGTSGKYLGQVPDGTPLTILGGPQCVDSRVWWEVQTQTKSPLVGWMMEGVPGVYYLELVP